jgi:hypothetical protein
MQRSKTQAMLFRSMRLRLSFSMAKQKGPSGSAMTEPSKEQHAEINRKVKKLSTSLGKGQDFTLSRLQILDIYKSGLYGGLKLAQ